MTKPPTGLSIGKSEENDDPGLARMLKNVQAAKVHLQEVRSEARQAGLSEALENTIIAVGSLEAELYHERKVPFQPMPLCKYD